MENKLNKIILEAIKDSEIKDSNSIYPSKIKDYDGYKIIFLAGPIQGSYEWHEKVIKLINEELKNKDIKYKIASPKANEKPKNFDYDKQVDWESYYLNAAAKNGVILFWLANEKEHDPKRAYAQTTRFEIAEWKTKQLHDKNINIIVGFDSNFPGDKYIRKRISEENPSIKIIDDLEKLVKEACEIILK